VGDYHILMQFDLAADRDVVHRALTTSDGISSWWTARAEGPDRRSDGELRVSFPDVPQPFEFKVIRADRERVEWLTGGFPPWWRGTSIRWDLADNPEAPGTRLLFSHRDYDADNPVIPIVTPAWAQIIGRLKGYVESGSRAPFFPAAAFGD
jgi:uncharacterized protein YndB with AHSA1/START domain